MQKNYNRFKKLKTKIIKKRKEKKQKKKEKGGVEENYTELQNPTQMQRFIITIKSVTEYTYTPISKIKTVQQK